MVLSTKLGIRILDLYFDEIAPSSVGVDVVRWTQAPRQLPRAKCTPFTTLLVDLSLPAEALLAQMKKQTRYEIRRASEKDELLYEAPSSSSPEVIATFADHFDRCAELKGMGKASRERLAILAGHDAVGFSFMRDKSGDILVSNCYVVTPLRVRMLHTASVFRAVREPERRALVGRASRLLLWRDLLRYQQADVRVFDFGGWYSGQTDQEKLRINAFKESFGGQLSNEWNCERALTLRGAAVLIGLRGRHKVLEATARRRSAALAAAVGGD